MALPTLTKIYDDLHSSTLERTLKTLTDNIFDAIPVLKVLKAKGKFVDHSGGTQINLGLEYGENQTVAWIGRGSKISIVDNPKFTQAQYDWKFLAGSVVRYFVDEQMNKAEPQIFNLVEKNILNLQKTLKKNLNAALMDDGSTDSNMLEGFKKYIQSTPATGTVGGIAAATNSWWRNQHTSMSGLDHTVYLIDNMREMYDDCSDDGGTDSPDMIITTKGIKNWYEDEALDSHYYTESNELADLGIKGCAFKGAPIMWTKECDTGLIYFVNSAYFEVAYDPSAWMYQTDWKDSQDNLERAMQVVSQLNLICSNREKQGLLSACTT